MESVKGLRQRCREMHPAIERFCFLVPKVMGWDPNVSGVTAGANGDEKRVKLPVTAVFFFFHVFVFFFVSNFVVFLLLFIHCVTGYSYLFYIYYYYDDLLVFLLFFYYEYCHNFIFHSLFSCIYSTKVLFMFFPAMKHFSSTPHRGVCAWCVYACVCVCLPCAYMVLYVVCSCRQLIVCHDEINQSPVVRARVCLCLLCTRV